MYNRAMIPFEAKPKSREFFTRLMKHADVAPEHVVLQGLVRKTWEDIVPKGQTPPTAAQVVKDFNNYARNAKIAHERDVIRLDEEGDGNMSYVYITQEDFNALITHFSRNFKNVPPQVRVLFSDLVIVMRLSPENIHMHYFAPFNNERLGSVAYDIKRIMTEALPGELQPRVLKKPMLRLIEDVTNPYTKLQCQKIQMSLEEYMAIQDIRYNDFEDDAVKPQMQALKDYLNFDSKLFSRGLSPLVGNLQAEKLMNRRDDRNRDRGLS